MWINLTNVFCNPNEIFEVESLVVGSSNTLNRFSQPVTVFHDAVGNCDRKWGDSKREPTNVS